MSRHISSLRFRLVLIVLFAVLPAILLILYSGFEQRRNAAVQAQENTKRILELASLHQSHLIEETRRLLFTLSETLPFYGGDMAKCSTHLSELLKRYPYYLNFGIIGTNGQVLCSAIPFEGNLDFSDRDYFQRALNGGAFAIGSCQIERITGRTSINFGLPVQDAEGNASSVVFAAMDLAWLSELATHLKFPEGSTLTVVGRGGTIFARYPDPELWVGKVIPNADILLKLLEKRNEGVAEAVGVDGVKRLYAFTPLDDSPHSTFLYTGVPVENVYAGANRALARNLIAIGIVTVLALFAAHLFGHLFVMRWVDALVRTARQLAKGNFSARIDMASGSSEIDQLGKAFDEMAQSLDRKRIERDQMEEALRRSETKYRTLVEQIPVVTYMAAPDEAHAITYISPQVDTLLGFDQEDFTANPAIWSKRLHPQDKERVLKEVSRCMAENDLFICEYRMLTFNGQVKWVRDEGVIVLDDARKPLFMQGVMIDITEQKRAEEELKEAHNELEVRVEERTQELARANENLRRSAEKLKFFAYSVVHDLKSPAIGAYGLTRLLQRQFKNVLDEKARQYCDQIMRASEHIAELVEKINIYIATKETPMRMESVSIQEILRILKEEFSAKLSLRNIEWIEPEGDIEVRADRLSVLRVFRNYVDNALKYGGEQLSQIRIGYQELDKFHVFSVSDDGQGVNEKDAGKIFQIFQRNAKPEGVEGAGLGLAIVKEIAHRHQGEVWMEPNPDSGTTFYLSIAKDLQAGNCQNAA